MARCCRRATLLALLAWAAPAGLRAQQAGAPDAGMEAPDAGPVEAVAAEAAAPSARRPPVGTDAGEDAPEPPRYESVVTADPYDPSGTSERLLRRSDLDRQGAHSVAEALERSPSTHATTGGRNERIVSIRGFEQRQTAVLVDGAPALVAYDGQVDLGMMPAELVDRVTVSRGPGTLAVGPAGLGPTVSIVTRRAGDGPLVQGRLEGGGPGGTWRGAALHSRRLERGGYTVYAGGERSQGFALPSSFEGTPLQPKGERINSDRRGWFAGASGVLAPAEGHEVALAASYVDAAKGVPPSTLDDTTRYWRFNVWRGLTATLGHAYRGRVQLEELAYLRLYDNLLDAYDDATFTTQSSLRASHTWHHDRSAGLILRLRAPLPEVLGIASQVRAFANLAYDRHTDSSSLPPFQRVLVTGAPELSLEFTRQLSATLACQVDAEVPVDLPGESSHAPIGAGPLVALRFEPTPAVTMGATVALRHRFPTLKERFSRGLGTVEPNPNLAPESAWHFDLEASWRVARWLSVDVSGFDAEVSDLIESVYLGGGSSRLQNVHRARLAGAEVLARVKVQPWLRAELGYAYQFARQVGGTSGRLPYRPDHKVGAGLAGTPWRWLEASTFVRYVGAQAFQHPTTLQWGTLTGYTVWDAQLEGRPWDGFALYARVTNLLDTSYQTQVGFPDPGRRIWVGLRLAFDEEPAVPTRSP